MLLQEDRQAPDAEFKPNLVNTVCFLVNWIIQITTFAVNYIGHPFNTALADNKGLAGCVRCALCLMHHCNSASSSRGNHALMSRSCYVDSLKVSGHNTWVSSERLRAAASPAECF